MLENPLYLPGLALADCMMFPKLKLVSKGHNFDDIETIRKNLTAVLTSILAQAFQKAFYSWHDRTVKYEEKEKVYFET